MHLFEGPDLGNSTELLWCEKGDKKKEEKDEKKQQQGIKPTTSHVVAT